MSSYLPELLSRILITMDTSPDHRLFNRLPNWDYPCQSMFAYYDPDADTAWFPTGESGDVVSEPVPGGFRDYDRTSHKLVAIEVWDASTRLPASILEALPAPGAAHRAVA